MYSAISKNYAQTFLFLMLLIVGARFSLGRVFDKVFN